MLKKIRIVMLNYYWETMKVDVSKMLLTNSTAKYFDAAKNASCHVFAVDVYK